MPETEPSEERQTTAPKPVRQKRVRTMAAGLVMFAGGDYLVHDAHPDQIRAASAAEGVPANPEAPARLQITFDHPETQAIANQLHLDPGDYLVASTDVIEQVDELDAFATERTVMPTVAPAVEDMASTIEEASLSDPDNLVSPTFIADILTMESAGNPEAHSGADAWGLGQIVPQYHLERFKNHEYLPVDASYADYVHAKNGEPSKVSFDEYKSAFTNPKASIEISVEIYRELLGSVRHHNPSMKPNSIRVYALAAMAYNGGESLLSKSADKIPTESKRYADYVTRMLIDGEIAARMKLAGVDSSQIRLMMGSTELDARSYAYQHAHHDKTYTSDVVAAQLASYPEPGIAPGLEVPDSAEAAGVYRRYHDYLSDKAPHYADSMPPGLRLWAASGGFGMYNKIPRNNP